jgi:hypothetical protein
MFVLRICAVNVPFAAAILYTIGKGQAAYVCGNG